MNNTSSMHPVEIKHTTACETVALPLDSGLMLCLSHKIVPNYGGWKGVQTCLDEIPRHQFLQRAW